MAAVAVVGSAAGAGIAVGPATHGRRGVGTRRLGQGRFLRAGRAPPEVCRPLASYLTPHWRALRVNRPFRRAKWCPIFQKHLVPECLCIIHVITQLVANYNATRADGSAAARLYE